MILDHLDLAICKGEFLTILGPSGAGKSTLLKVILGLLTPELGRIQLAGEDITHAAVNERRIGMVFQDYSLFPTMSVRDNVAFPLVAARARNLGSLLLWRYRSAARISVNTRVEAVLELVHLTAHARKKPAQLSGGEQQRVALARAIAFSPNLLCLDEPLSALDRELRQELQYEIRALQQRLGTTVLYVTHDQAEALALSDRVAILNEGRIEQIGTPQDVYTRPATQFVAQFLGDCNIFPIRRCTALQNGHVRVETAGGTMLVASEKDSDGKCSVGIRPEHLHCSQSNKCNEPLEGTLVDAVFQGHYYRLHVALPCGELLTAVVPSGTFAIQPERGVTLGFYYDPESAFLL